MPMVKSFTTCTKLSGLEKLGVCTAYALEDIPDGAGVLIRAHGVPRNVYTLLQAKKCEIFDATCPFVRKIHKIADKESADGRLIVILGSAGHPEVVGIQGWCGESVVLEGEERREPSRNGLKWIINPFLWSHRPLLTGQFGIFP